MSSVLKTRSKSFATTILLSVSLCMASVASAQSKDWTSIRIATEGAYKPWNFTDSNGKLVGLEIELAENLCKRMNAKCEIVAQAFDGMIPAINAGKFDAIMATMNITDKRKEAISFSRPYGQTPTTFAVLKSNSLAKLPEAGKVYSLASEGTTAAESSLASLKPLLKGKLVGVQTSTAHANFLDKYFKDVVEIRQYKTTEQYDLDLAAGRLDAVFGSISYLKGMVESKGNSEMMLSGPRYVGGVLGAGVAVGIRKTDPELRDKFDAAVGAAIADGTVKTLSMKWFGFDITPAQR